MKKQLDTRELVKLYVDVRYYIYYMSTDHLRDLATVMIAELANRAGTDNGGESK